MNGSIFDAVEEPRTGTILDLADKVDHLVPDEYHDEDIPWYQSYASALGKGLIKGTVEFGRMMGPLMEPYDPQELKARLDEMIPSEEGFVEGALERSGELFPLVSTGGGGILKSAARTGGAALSSETAKQLGAPEWLQSLSELPALIGPEITKMLKAGKSNKEIVDFARKQGLKEEQIAPLLQGEGKQRFLGKVAKKGGKAEKVLSETKKAVGDIYQRLYEIPEASKSLRGKKADKVIDKMQNLLEKMPANVRAKISKDFRELKNSSLSGKDFMNFNADINANLSGQTKQLSALKSPVADAINQIDPKLASEFKLTNKLYSNAAQISKTLKPTMVSKFIEGSLPYRFAYGVITGNPGVLAESIGEHSLGLLSRELLINPRYQNLQRKMVSAINENKFPAAKNIWKMMTQEVSKHDKETADKMRDIDILNLLESK